MIFDPAESDKPIFKTFRGTLISEVVLLIELFQLRTVIEQYIFPHFKSLPTRGLIITQKTALSIGFQVGISNR